MGGAVGVWEKPESQKARTGAAVVVAAVVGVGIEGGGGSAGERAQHKAAYGCAMGFLFSL